MLSSTFLQSCSTTVGDPILQYKVREPLVESTAPPLLLLLHGVGSNESDLFQLAAQLPDEYLIITARAPIAQGRNSFKWYDIDFSTGRPVMNDAQAAESLRLLKRFVEQLKSLHTWDHDRLIVGGFSQGAIMAYNIGMTEPELVHGVIALSGRVVESIKPLVAPGITGNLMALIVHGTQDRLLPLAYARQAKHFLEEYEVAVDYHEITAGHTITSETIELINGWLTTR